MDVPALGTGREGRNRQGGRIGRVGHRRDGEEDENDGDGDPPILHEEDERPHVQHDYERSASRSPATARNRIRIVEFRQ